MEEGENKVLRHVISAAQVGRVRLGSRLHRSHSYSQQQMYRIVTYQRMYANV